MESARVWGGRPTPLVFARAASFAARTAQALLRPSTDSEVGCSSAAAGRLQLYVDDPVVSVVGTEEQRNIAIDLVLLWWLVLVLPLAWLKGLATRGVHRWIGADFELVNWNTATEPQQQRMQDSSWAAAIRPPPEFLEDLAADLAVLASGAGAVTVQVADRTVGRAGRLAYLVPACRAFVLSLYAALTAGKAALEQAQGRQTDATSGRLPVARFASAARWLLALIRPRPEAQEDFPLEHFIIPDPPKISFRTAWVVSFDASLWGGGAILYVDQAATEWFEIPWKSFDLSPHRACAGRSQAPICL